MDFSSIRQVHANNVAVLRRSPISEISGSLGDLGTLLPLMIALAVNNSISLSTTLVFSGLWNILTGVFFGIPLPVQPMKVCILLAYLLDDEESLIPSGHRCSSHRTEVLHWRDRIRRVYNFRGGIHLQCHWPPKMVYSSDSNACCERDPSWCRAFSRHIRRHQSPPTPGMDLSQRSR